MGKKLVFVGAGHAHLTALARCREYISRGHQVTVINPSPYHYYSGMGPGMLSGIYRPQDIRFHIKKMVEERGAAFLQNAVIGIDPRKRLLRLADGAEAGYDVVSFNTGSGVPADGLDTGLQDVFPVKPIINLLKARERLLTIASNREARVVVIGGGPAGVEIAGNAWRLVKDAGAKAGITLIPGEQLLRGFPERARRVVRSSFRSRGIVIREGMRAEAAEDHSLRLSDGGMIPFDVCFPAIGVKPSSLFTDSGLPTGRTGGMLVNYSLQSVSHPELFGGGDCIDLEGRDLAKVGVYAVRENPVLFGNLMAALENGSMKGFEPQHRFMLIFNLGDGTGLARRGGFVWNGKLAFLLKDYIDRKFMRTFQVSGERDEN